MKGLLIAAGGGLLLWWYYKNQTPAVGTPITTPATGTTTTPPASSAPAFNSLAAIYTRIHNAVPANQSYTADGWNVYLKQQSSVSEPPDPAVVFAGSDRNAPMTLAQYWAVMSQYLMANNGMSGFRGMGGWRV